MLKEEMRMYITQRSTDMNIPNCVAFLHADDPHTNVSISIAGIS